MCWTKINLQTKQHTLFVLRREWKNPMNMCMCTCKYLRLTKSNAFSLFFWKKRSISLSQTPFYFLKNIFFDAHISDQWRKTMHGNFRMCMCVCVLNFKSIVMYSMVCIKIKFIHLIFFHVQDIYVCVGLCNAYSYVKYTYIHFIVRCTLCMV